jgi:hypothetical protein
MKFSLEQMYPNITRWVYEHEGWIEIGDRVKSPLTSFVRSIVVGCCGSEKIAMRA